VSCSPHCWTRRWVAREREEVECTWPAVPTAAGELEGLRSTVSLLSRVEARSSPVGFVDKVMGEVYPAPWYLRLGRLVFLPLSVKLPLEAGAMVLIAILGVYLLQSTPEMKDAARLMLQRWHRVRMRHRPHHQHHSAGFPPASLERGRGQDREQRVSDVRRAARARHDVPPQIRVRRSPR